MLYGIKNCDTVKKARAWLESNSIDYQFHDYRIDGLTSELLQRFASELGWSAMLNRSSTSWRQLSAEQQADLNADKAIALMLATPTLIKRPILDTSNKMLIGFKVDEYAANLTDASAAKVDS